MNNAARAKQGLIIAAIALFFFLLLPYPFTVNRMSCVQPCKKITEYTLHEQTSWSWLGGYHIIVERFFIPMPGDERESYISKYFGVTIGGTAKLGAISLCIGAGLYFILRKSVKYGRARRSRK